MAERYRVTRSWYVDADGPVEAIEKTTANSGVPHSSTDARPVLEGEESGDVPVVELRTRNPEDFELVSYRTGSRWIIREGHWVRQAREDWQEGRP